MLLSLAVQNLLYPLLYDTSLCVNCLPCTYVLFTALIAHWTPHHDSVTSLSVFEREEKMLVVSTSSDHCVVLNELKGMKSYSTCLSC